MEKLEIQGELHFVESPERFAWILEEKLGADAAQYFLSTPTTNKCCGECDRTYEIQEHYEQGIGNVVEDLKVILFSKRKNKKNIDEILVALESLL